MKKFLAFVLSASALTLVACGDDVTKVYENSGITMLESGEKLSKQSCDSTNVGDFLFVKDSSATFMCDGKSWVNLNGEDGKDGKGSKGAPGAAGTACTVKKVTKKKSTGYVLTCDKDVVDTLWNGTEGAKGASGDDGVGCKVASDKDGVVTLVCGEGKDADTTKLYKAVCGKDSYDPAEISCYEGQIGNFCGGKTYDTSKKFCFNGKIEDFCGGKSFDPSKKFCYNGELEDLCGGTSFDPSKKFCYDGKTEDLCGGNSFDPSQKFCYKGEPKDLCGGKSFDFEAEYCFAGSLKSLPSCNGKTYNPNTHYCLKEETGETIKEYGFFTDNRDTKHPQTYKTVKIGEQVWMAENLNYGDSDAMPNLKGATWCGGGSELNEGDCSVYGRLYTWTAAVNKSESECGNVKCNLSGSIQGVCPDGWHLPDTTEFKSLLNAVGENSGNKLKFNSGWERITSKGVEEVDAFGFSALPAGYRDNDEQNFKNMGSNARFWSISEKGDIVHYLYLTYSEASASIDGDGKSSFSLSVRCVQDAAN